MKNSFTGIAFKLVVDLFNKKYISITIDGETKDLSTIDLAQLYQPSWGDDVSLIITTEFMAAWPQMDCSDIFTWTTIINRLYISLLQAFPAQPCTFLGI